MKITGRQKKALETKKRILGTALHLFETKDFESVSMEEIAEHAQVSIGTIYYYFQSKENIAAQTLYPLDDIYHKYFEKIQNPEESGNLDPIEKLKKYYINVHDVLALQTNLRNIYIYSLKNPASETLKIAESRMLYRDYHALLKQCREQKYLITDVDDEEIIVFLTQASRGMLIESMIFGASQNSIQMQAERWFDLIINGIHKPNGAFFIE